MTDTKASTGTMIYGIVPADVEPTETALGVGDPPAPIDTVAVGEVAERHPGDRAHRPAEGETQPDLRRAQPDDPREEQHRAGQERAVAERAGQLGGGEETAGAPGRRGRAFEGQRHERNARPKLGPIPDPILALSIEPM